MTGGVPLHFTSRTPLPKFPSLVETPGSDTRGTVVRLGGEMAPGTPALRAQRIPTAPARLSPARRFPELRWWSPCPPPTQPQPLHPLLLPKAPHGQLLAVDKYSAANGSRGTVRFLSPAVGFFLSVHHLLVLAAGGWRLQQPRSPQPSCQEPPGVFSPETVHVSAHFFMLLSHLSGVSLHCCPGSSPSPAFIAGTLEIHLSVASIT